MERLMYKEFRDDRDFDTDQAIEILELINWLSHNQHGGATHVELNAYSCWDESNADEVSFETFRLRQETNVEFEKRKALEKKREEYGKENRRKDYEALKAEFEGEVI